MFVNPASMQNLRDLHVFCRFALNHNGANCRPQVSCSKSRDTQHVHT